MAKFAIGEIALIESIGFMGEFGYMHGQEVRIESTVMHSTPPYPHLGLGHEVSSPLLPDNSPIWASLQILRKRTPPFDWKSLSNPRGVPMRELEPA